MSSSPCPVCESPLDFEPWSNGVSSQEICPSCGIHFGYNDARASLRLLVYEGWRREWIARGRRPIDGADWKQVGTKVVSAAWAWRKANERVHVLRPPSDKLLQLIRGWIADARAGDHVGMLNADYTGLLIYGDIGGAAYIRADGSIDIEDDLPGSSWSTDPNILTSVLVCAVKRRPELAELLPERKALDTNCADCGATGWETLGSITIICEICHGLGWVSPQ